MPKSTQRTDRLGVAKVTEFFARVGWLFREQVIDDYGIDGHVEIVEHDRPLGAPIGMHADKIWTELFSRRN
jgi:hypothetical protein